MKQEIDYGSPDWNKFHAELDIEKENFNNKIKDIKFDPIEYGQEKSIQRKINDLVDLYEPLNLNDFIYKENNNFRKKMGNCFNKMKNVIPFLLRKDKWTNFSYYGYQRNEKIKRIKDLMNRLDMYDIYGTQPSNNNKRIVSKWYSHITFEDYLQRKLDKRLQLYVKKATLFQKLMDINEKLDYYKGGVCKTRKHYDLLKQKKTILNKIEKLKIKIYETQKHK